MKTNPHTPKGARARSRFIFLEIASYKRCSRPLCSSQTTTPYHTPHTHHPKGKQPCDRCSQETRNTSPTPHTPPPKGQTVDRGPVVSGPNSVPNTKPRNQTPHRSRTTALPKKREDPYWAPGKNTRPLFADIPPVSTRRRTIVCATGLLLTTPPHPHTWGTVVVGAP